MSMTMPTALLLLATLASGCSRSRSDTAPPAVALYVQGVRAYQAGDRDRAIATLARANRANPNLTMSRALLGDIYRSIGDYRAAADQYEQSTRLDPYGASAHYNLAVTYQLLNRLQESAASYLRALKLNPLDINANMNLGLVYLSLGDLPSAAVFTGKAVDLDPENPVAVANYAVAMEADGKTSEAVALYRRSLDLDPNQQTTIFNLAGALLKQKQPHEAISTLRHIAPNSTDAIVHKRYADALAMAGHLDEAIGEYAAALKLDPKYYPAMNDIGRAMVARYRSNFEMDEEMRQQAVLYWKASLTVNPRQPKIVELIKQWNRYRP